MEIDYTFIGNQIKIIRKQKKLTQAQLAEAVGISPQFVSKIETGQNIMSLETFIKIADFLEVSTDELLRGAKLPSKNMEQEIPKCIWNRMIYLDKDAQECILALINFFISKLVKKS